MPKKVDFEIPSFQNHQPKPQPACETDVTQGGYFSIKKGDFTTEIVTGVSTASRNKKSTTADSPAADTVRSALCPLRVDDESHGATLRSLSRRKGPPFNKSKIDCGDASGRSPAVHAILTPHRGERKGEMCFFEHKDSTFISKTRNFSSKIVTFSQNNARSRKNKWTPCPFSSCFRSFLAGSS